MAEMRKVILVEVSTLKATMQKLYDKFLIVHKVVVHQYGFQWWRRNIVQTLEDIHAAIAQVQEWTMRYKGALLHLPKMMKPQLELDKAKIWIQIQNYENRTLFISSI